MSRSGKSEGTLILSPLCKSVFFPTELDGQIRPILSRLNKNKDYIYINKEIVKGNYVQLH